MRIITVTRYRHVTCYSRVSSQRLDPTLGPLGWSNVMLVCTVTYPRLVCVVE